MLWTRDDAGSKRVRWRCECWYWLKLASLVARSGFVLSAGGALRALQGAIVLNLSVPRGGTAALKTLAFPRLSGCPVAQHL